LSCAGNPGVFVQVDQVAQGNRTASASGVRRVASTAQRRLGRMNRWVLCTLSSNATRPPLPRVAARLDVRCLRPAPPERHPQKRRSGTGPRTKRVLDDPRKSRHRRGAGIYGYLYTK
jgi:hypothetical protein